MQDAIAIMKAEHRALGAVLHALLGIVDDLALHRADPDFDTLRTMIDYIDRYPNRFHHPKEDWYLFRLLRFRAQDVGGLLDALEAEHRQNTALMEGMRRALERYASHPADQSALQTFRELVRQYAEFHWSHMRLEEEQVFPLAEARLLPQDWDEINTAFRDNRDPLIGCEAKEQYQEMLRRITAAVPPPFGVGDSRS